MNRLTTAGTVSISEAYGDVAVAPVPARIIKTEYDPQAIEYVVVSQGTVPFPETFHPRTERERIRAALVAAGLSLPASNTPAAGQLSPEQREELAHRVSVGTPLSQIIIEERHER